MYSEDFKVLTARTNRIENEYIFDKDSLKNTKWEKEIDEAPDTLKDYKEKLTVKSEIHASTFKEENSGLDGAGEIENRVASIGYTMTAGSMGKSIIDYDE